MITKVYYVKVLPQRDIGGTTFIPRLDDAFKKPCTLLLDQATNSGFAIYDARSALVMVGTWNIERGESLFGYKTRLQEQIISFIETYQIEQIIFEETYVNNPSTAETLHYIKHGIEDLRHVHNIRVDSVASNKWKSILARPDVFRGNGNDKAEVKKYVEQTYPLLFAGKYAHKLSEDMVDVLGMGIALMLKMGRNGGFQSALKYDKALPLEYMVIPSDDIHIVQEVLATTRKVSFKHRFLQDGYFELDTTYTSKILEGIRQYLSHRGGLVLAKVPRGHKFWAVWLMEKDISFQDLPPSLEYYLVAYSKKEKFVRIEATQ